MAKKKKSQEENDTVYIEEVSVAQEIAEIQLERLRMISRERLLGYEETKIYDLLTKNLLLSKGKATDIVGSAKKVSNNISTEKLIQIAKEMPDSPIAKSLDVVDSDDDK